MTVARVIAALKASFIDGLKIGSFMFVFQNVILHKLNFAEWSVQALAPPTSDGHTLFAILFILPAYIAVIFAINYSRSSDQNL